MIGRLGARILDGVGSGLAHLHTGDVCQFGVGLHHLHAAELGQRTAVGGLVGSLETQGCLDCARSIGSEHHLGHSGRRQRALLLHRDVVEVEYHVVGIAHGMETDIVVAVGSWGQRLRVFLIFGIADIGPCHECLGHARSRGGGAVFHL